MAKHKCKIPDPPPDTTRWMGTYGDMVTLLMAFFVMLFAVSETNNQKFEAFVAGLAGPFDNPAVSLGLVDGAALMESSVSPISLIAPQPGSEEIMAPTDVVDEVLETVEAKEQLEGIEGQLEEILSQTTVPISTDLRDDERGLVVSISTDDVLFPVGSAEMSDIGRQLIAEIAPVLVAAPNTVVIEGHTDNQPLVTPGYSNWNLSTDRAVAVLELLGDEYGLPFARISATGYGEHRPLVPNSTPANQSKNRRVEILVVGLDIARDGAAPPPSGAEADAPAPTAPAPGPAPGSEVVDVGPIDPIGDPIGADDMAAAVGPGEERSMSRRPAGSSMADILGE